MILGFLVIGLALVNIKSPVPSYSWAGVEDLSTKVFSGGNLVNIIIQLVFVFVVALIGMLLTGKPLKYFLYVFPVVYTISMLALVLAGNKQVKALNLEAVCLPNGALEGSAIDCCAYNMKGLSVTLFSQITLSCSSISSNVLPICTVPALRAASAVNGAGASSAQSILNIPAPYRYLFNCEVYNDENLCPAMDNS